MKKLLSITMLLAFAIAVYAQQEKEVTQFLGIPVDGSKTEMIQKLKEKGFVSSAIDKNILEGEFNGAQVNVYVVTNKNKVCRIMLCDAHQIDETNIKIRFNNLCNQFANNPKYISSEDFTIPESEDISYEMSVNNKRYEAIFHQRAVITDSLAMANEIKEIILQKYSEEDLENIFQKYSEENLENPTDDIKTEITKMALPYVVEYVTDLTLKKPVWFMISEFHGKYYIVMYYDNEYNRANGEDL